MGKLRKIITTGNCGTLTIKSDINNVIKHIKCSGLHMLTTMPYYIQRAVELWMSLPGTESVQLTSDPRCSAGRADTALDHDPSTESTAYHSTLLYNNNTQICTVWLGGVMVTASD